MNQELKRVCIICEPASHASQHASHASQQASHASQHKTTKKLASVTK